MEILRTEGLTKDFPGVRALDQVTFSLRRGEIHGVVGENGAGKSTLVKILSGVHQPTEGKIFIEEKQISFHSPRESMPYIGVVHQERELVPIFTGIQNLFLGQEIAEHGILKKSHMRRIAEEFARRFELPVELDVPVRGLSSGKQELLTILKVLFRDPPILIFDEPTASLSSQETKAVFKLIRSLKEKGKSIIYISHHLPEVLSLSDRITVLRNGKKVITTESHGLQEKDLIRFMIAKDLKEQYPKQEVSIGKPILEVEGISFRLYPHRNIRFHVCSGEIVGFAGLVGSGRTELAKSLFLGSPLQQGHIIIAGKNFTSKSPLDSIRQGMVMIPENRRAEGIISSFSVVENLVLPSLFDISFLGIRNREEIQSLGSRIIQRLSIKVVSPHQKVTKLSGGNQQKVSLGKWLEKNAILWIFDEPTQGIDVETKSEIYTIMGNIASKGGGIWFISSDLRELIALCDRIYVMYDYAIVAEFKKPFDSEQILKAMHGGKGIEDER